MLIANNKLYLGLFFICLATLMFEVLMPRIWSVSMWYHFAFVAISIAMLGITGGSLLVYIFPKYFSADRSRDALAKASFLFSISIVFSLLTQMSMPFFPDRSITGLYSLSLILIVASIPFWLSGLCIALILSKLSKKAGSLYATDLVGAALGCLMVLAVLKVTDGPTAVIFSAVLAAIGSVFFALNGSSKKLVKASCLLLALLMLLACGNTLLVYKQSSLLRLIWVKAKFEDRPLYESWNSFCRLAVAGDVNNPGKPFGWGLSRVFNREAHKTPQLNIYMDAFNGTVLPHFNGDFNEVDYLKYDLPNIAHYLRQKANVLIIGTGSGRDVLAALAFKQKSIVGVEINENVIAAITKRFADFSGHLDSYPEVKFINDEARSYIARQKPNFDIIQMSIIDTGSTTGAGAIALAENSLYTKEAWKVFLQRLHPGGILSCTRWYYEKMPAETYRLVSLAAAALKEIGVADPSKNLIVIKPKLPADDKDETSVCTLLASNRPFSADDLKVLKDTCQSLQFDILLCPDCQSDPTLLAIAKQGNLDSLKASLPINIEASTDNNPFFFYLLKPTAPIHPDLLGPPTDQLYGRAQLVIFQLLVAVSILSFVSIICPLFLTNKKMDFWQGLPLLGYFAAIGSGFMLIEISQMQRFIIFLGHPSYSLSVVLFTLLLSGGAGSYLTYLGNNSEKKVQPVLFLACLIASLLAFAYLSPGILNHYSDAITPMRILVAALLIAPIGLFMGMSVPMGINAASKHQTELIPWLWAVNGAASVVASVVAVAIAITFGIAQSYFVGVAFYILAALLIARDDYSQLS